MNVNSAGVLVLRRHSTIVDKPGFQSQHRFFCSCHANKDGTARWLSTAVQKYHAAVNWCHRQVCHCSDILVILRVGKYRDILENIRFFNVFYIYRVFAHTLLNLCEIYYQIIICVCVLCILVKYSCHSHCIAVERCNLTEVVQHWENAEGTSHKPAKHADWKSKYSHSVWH